MKELPRKLRRRFAHLKDLFFGLILQLRILVRRKTVFGRDDTEFFQPLSIDFETAGTLPHRLPEYLLPFFPEKPVDKHFGRVRMGRSLEDGQMTAAPADVDLVAWIWKRFYRKSGLEVRNKRIIGNADHKSDFSLSEALRQYPLIAAQEQLLLD